MRGFRRHKFPKPFRGPGILRASTFTDDAGWFESLPDNVKRNLDKAADEDAFGPRASGLGGEEVIYTRNADGTAITAAAEPILLPDFSIPASYLSLGKVLKYTIMGRQSTAITTTRTIIHRLRWGGVAGVVVVLS